MATAAIRAAVAAITAEADLVVALAAPVQAALVATAAGMEAARVGAATAMAMAEGMVGATAAAENADIIGMIPIPPMCRTMQLVS
jgi:hypothetical protein